MKHEKFNHLSGIHVVPNSIQIEIEQAIAAITIQPAKGKATTIRDIFLKSIGANGWSAEVPVSKNSKITVTSVKSDVGLCLQTGNMARIYADLLKLQTMYINKAINSAVIVVPSKPVAAKLGDNIANAKRLEKELEVFKHAYSVPTVVFSLE